MNNDRYPTIGSWGKKYQPGGLCVICKKKDADCEVNLMLDWVEDEDIAAKTKAYPIHENCYLNTPPIQTLQAMIQRYELERIDPPLNKKQFAELKGKVCPRCHGLDIAPSNTDVLTLVSDNQIVIRPMYCNVCGLVFTADYYLEGFTIVGYK